MQHIQQTRPNANHYLNVYLPTMRAPCFNNKRCSQASPTATPKPKPGNRKQHGGSRKQTWHKKIRPREKCRSKPNGRRTIKLPATNPKRGILGEKYFCAKFGQLNCDSQLRALCSRSPHRAPTEPPRTSHGASTESPQTLRGAPRGHKNYSRLFASKFKLQASTSTLLASK